MKTEVSSSFPLVCAGERGDDDLVEGRGETRACLKISTEYLLLWLENTNEVDCRGRKSVGIPETEEEHKVVFERCVLTARLDRRLCWYCTYLR